MQQLLIEGSLLLLLLLLLLASFAAKEPGPDAAPWLILIHIWHLRKAANSVDDVVRHPDCLIDGEIGHRAVEGGEAAQVGLVEAEHALEDAHGIQRVCRRFGQLPRPVPASASSTAHIARLAPTAAIAYKVPHHVVSLLPLPPPGGSAAFVTAAPTIVPGTKIYKFAY